MSEKDIRNDEAAFCDYALNNSSISDFIILYFTYNF